MGATAATLAVIVAFDNGGSGDPRAETPDEVTSKRGSLFTSSGDLPYRLGGWEWEKGYSGGRDGWGGRELRGKAIRAFWGRSQ